MMMKTSILIRTGSDWENTRQCLWGISTFTQGEAYEILLLVDVEPAERPAWLMDEARIIIGGDTAGAINCAIQQAQGEEIVLMAPDVIVTDQWLSRLRAALYYNEKTAAVGPVSYMLLDSQAVLAEERKEYSSVQEICVIAQELADRYAGQYWEANHLSGACILLRRRSIEQIGELSDEYLSVDMSIVDLEMRLLKAEWHFLVAGEVWIHKGRAAYNYLYQSTDIDAARRRLGFSPIYSWGIRDDLLRLVNLNLPDLHFMDIGCSCGGTLMRVGERNPGAKLFGIELAPEAARIAANYGSIMQESIEDITRPDFDGKFDYIMMGDVLEHLVDTVGTLAKVRSWLKPGGSLIVSVPNIGHISIIAGLLLGRWSYQDAGILDRTHMRFFTRSEMEQLLNQQGFEVIKVQATHVNSTESLQQLEAELLQLRTARVRAEDLQAFQWIFVARKR